MCAPGAREGRWATIDCLAFKDVASPLSVPTTRSEANAHGPGARDFCDLSNGSAGCHKAKAGDSYRPS